MVAGSEIALGICDRDRPFLKKCKILFAWRRLSLTFLFYHCSLEAEEFASLSVTIATDEQTEIIQFFSHSGKFSLSRRVGCAESKILSLLIWLALKAVFSASMPTV